MPIERPGSATAAAVLAIIYGSLMTLCGLCGAVMLVSQGALGNNFMGGADPAGAKIQKDLDAALVANVPAYHFMQIFNSVTLAMLVGGIALLTMASWSRKFTIIVAALGIVDVVQSVLYQYIFVWPATNQFFQAGMPAIPNQKGMNPNAAANVQLAAQGMQVFMSIIMVGVGVLAVVFVVYLTIVIVLLSRRHVREAYAGIPSFPALEEERWERERDDRRRDDYDDDDDWRPSDDPKDDRFRA